MEIEIQTRRFSLTDALRAHVLKRLGPLVRGRGSHIRCVRVWLSDINGPRGGADKRCRIQLVLTRRPAVVVQQTDADLYTAIDRATRRARHTLARRLPKRHRQARTTPYGNFAPTMEYA
ncbi:MAG TPA: HPF/RaiA family ribosome-associated protein [Chromatiales bacterium]|nr:HPF/RaiA family ribosome-associated protein [Chromatiales bacterium]